MNIKFGTIEKTGKKEFMERVFEQSPKGIELKIATLNLEQNNENVKKR